MTLRHRCFKRACAEPELQQLDDVGSALANEVGACDAAVDGTVLHVLRHVSRAHEQDVERCVATGEGERSFAGLLRAEPRVAEQRHGRLAQPALGRDRDYVLSTLLRHLFEATPVQRATWSV